MPFGPMIATRCSASIVNDRSSTALTSWYWREKTERSEPSYARAASIEPNNFDAQYLHGLMLQLLDRVADAISGTERV